MSDNDGSVRRILVIDDEPVVADLLRDALVMAGHRVDVAVSGVEGLELAAGESYDLVFTDLGLPDISGWDISRKLTERSPDVPVVLVTGWGADLDPDELAKAKIAAVIEKPFAIADLLGTAEALLAA